MRKVFFDQGIPDFYWDADTNTLHVPPDGNPVGSGAAAKFTTVTPTALSADVDDYSPPDFGPGVLLRLNATSPAPSPDAFNPSDKDASITLSNSNRTATGTGGGWVSVRSVTPHDDQKLYFEWDGSGFFICGFGTGSASLSSYCGSDANGWGVRRTNGDHLFAFHNGSSVELTGLPLASGTVRAKLCVDPVNGKAWAGLGADWDGDPSAGTGPTWTFTPGTSVYLMGSTYTSGSCDIHVGQDAMDHATPSGATTGWPDAGVQPSNIDINGLLSLDDGETCAILNLSPITTFTLKNGAGSSTDAYRLALSADIVLSQFELQWLVYDGVLERFLAFR